MTVLATVLTIYFSLKILLLIIRFQKNKNTWEKIEDLDIKITGKKGGHIRITKEGEYINIDCVDKDGKNILTTRNE